MVNMSEKFAQKIRLVYLEQHKKTYVVPPLHAKVNFAPTNRRNGLSFPNELPGK